MSFTDNLKLPDFQGKSLFDGIASLDSFTEEADQEGAFASLPKTTSQQGKGAFYRSRIKTARTRLHLLGYLKNDRGGGIPGKTFKKAVASFQDDCGIQLKTDALLGPKTWQALAELVSFEDDTNLDRWWSHQIVLERALRLRLQSLGFLKIFEGDINLGLQRFMAIYNAYFAQDQPLQTPFSRRTYETVFNLDHLIANIAKAPPQILAKANLRPFLIAVSKIELWLLGYGVKPDGLPLLYLPPPPEKVKNRPLPPDRMPASNLPYLKGSLALAMQQFWKDLGLSRSEARQKATQLDQAFFKELHNAEIDSSEESPQEIADELLKSPKSMPGIVGALKNLGHRLWDGIKRAGRWVINLVRKGIKMVSSFAKTVGRLLYNASINAFDKLRSFFTGFKLSLQLLIGKYLPGTNRSSLVMQKRRDFDINMAIDQNLPDQEISERLDLFTKVTQIFGQCAKIFKAFITLIIGAVRATITGFAGLIIALVKFVPRAKALIQGLNYNDQLVDELKTLKANLDGN